MQFPSLKYAVKCLVFVKADHVNDVVVQKTNCKHQIKWMLIKHVMTKIHFCFPGKAFSETYESS